MHPLSGTRRGGAFPISENETDLSDDPGRACYNLYKSHEILKAHYHVKKNIEDLSAELSWRNLPEIPSTEEILGVGKQTKSNSEPEIWNEYQNDPLYDPELPINIIDGPWPSSDAYLTAHYKILREDAIASLREAVKTFKQRPSMMEDGEVFIYTEVTIIGWQLTRHGPVCQVEFCTDRSEKRIRWEQSKRLTQGTIVALSLSHNLFNTDCRVATVASRMIEGGLDQSPPTINLFFGDNSKVGLDPHDKYIMIEASNGYFEASRHMLVAMQKLMNERFPLKKHLVSIDSTVETPEYLESRPFLDILPLLEHTQQDSSGKQDKGRVAELIWDVRDDFPREVETGMDVSQTRALQNMMTRSLSIVQGPPGTGKTFVSISTLKLMINNLRPDDPPIIVAAQTNHALDQLLNHILKFETNIVRLGGQSARTNTKIRERTLFELHIGNKIKENRTAMIRCIRELEKLVDKIRIILSPLLTDDLLTPEQLLEYKIITEQQRKSFSALNWADNEASENEVVNWLGSDQIMSVKRASPVNLGLPLEDDFAEYDQKASLVEKDEDVDDLDDQFDPDNAGLKGIWIPYHRKFTGSHMGTIDTRKWKKRVAKIRDLYEIHENERGAAYRYFEMRVDSIMLKNFKSALKEYEELINEYKIARVMDRYRNLCTLTNFSKAVRDILLVNHLGVKIIGCTTSGLAKYRGFLSALQPRILLIEEAAETLEGKIIAGTPESIQQLIMVGDHKQLQASCTVRPLQESPYYMKISMFERLVKNNHPYVMLNKQRRMIPEVRELLCIKPKPFYEDLHDHQIVLDRTHARPHVPGMGGRDTYFFHHNWPEGRNLDGSCYNEDEAEMVAAFFCYLYLNGLDHSKITILTFYRGQKSLIIKMLREHVNLTNIDFFNVCTVDGYQGEENDVILLSLVRSNMPRTIGFLDNKNRFVVALSRARRGLYIFGNSVTLTASESDDPHQGRQPLWLPLIYHLASKKRFDMDNGFPLTCARHGTVTVVHEAADLDNLAGGCTKKCDKGLLPCKHKCPLNCHPFEHDEVNCCQEPCTKTLVCGHECSVMCSGKCFCDICDIRDDGALETEIPKTETQSSEPALERSSCLMDQRNIIDHDDSLNSHKLQKTKMTTWNVPSSVDIPVSKNLPRDDDKNVVLDSKKSNITSHDPYRAWAQWNARKADNQAMLQSMNAGSGTPTLSTVVLDDSHKQITVRDGVRTISKNKSRTVIDNNSKPEVIESLKTMNSSIPGKCSPTNLEKNFSLIDQGFSVHSKTVQGPLIEINEPGNSANKHKMATKKPIKNPKDIRMDLRKKPTIQKNESLLDSLI